MIEDFYFFLWLCDCGHLWQRNTQKNFRDRYHNKSLKAYERWMKSRMETSPPKSWISGVFRYSGTPEGNRFWVMVDELWEMYLEQDKLPTEEEVEALIIERELPF